MAKATKPAKQNTSTKVGPALGKKNIYILAISVVLVILGFILMGGGGSKDPNVFSWAIFSARRIIIAPFFVILGFIVGIYGILYNSK